MMSVLPRMMNGLAAYFAVIARGQDTKWSTNALKYVRERLGSRLGGLLD